MFYQFPTITNIEQVRKAIEGRSEFFEAVRDGFIVFNYTVNFPETFPAVESENDALLRECRGIIFCSQTGNVLARRLHKFFNVNERDETKIEKIDISKPHMILEKLDGSMITPFEVNGDVRWGTKMGVTEVAGPVEEWVKKPANTNYIDFARYCIGAGLTPIFEWCSRQQRIVIDYPVDRLVLIAVRNNMTGEYAPYSIMRHFAREYNLDIVRQYEGNVESMERLVNETRGLNDQEGWVVRFVDGHMVKIKSDHYVTLHRAKSLLDNERDVVGVVVSNAVDDLIPLLNTEDRDRLISFSFDVWACIAQTVNKINQILKTIQMNNMSRKDFSLQYDYENPIVRSTIFSNWGKDSIDEEPIVTFIKNHLGSKSAYDKCRNIITAHWNKTGKEE